VKIEKITDIKIGLWYYTCCDDDLFQIKNEKDLQYVIKEISELEDGSTLDGGVFETKEEALADINEKNHA